MCTAYPNICLNAWISDIMILATIFIHTITISGKKNSHWIWITQFTISNIHHRCVLFTLFLVQLLTTLNYPFLVQIWTPDNIIFTLPVNYYKILPYDQNKNIGQREHKVPEKLNLVVHFNERVNLSSMVEPYQGRNQRFSRGC